MTASQDPRDAEVDLDARPGPTISDQGPVATAVRQALIGTVALTPEQRAKLITAAVRRAKKRRHRRRAGASLLIVCGAAAASAVAVVSPGAVLGLIAGPDATAPRYIAAQQEEVEPMLLTLAEVQAVFPSARFAGTVSSSEGELKIPVDACGTSALADVSSPLGAIASTWTSPDARSGVAQAETDQEVVLRSEIAMFPSSADATAFAAALQRSVYTCEASNGQQAPVFPYVYQMQRTPSLYVSGYANGILDISVVVLRGADAVTVRAWVPVNAAQSPATAEGAAVESSPVFGADPTSLDSAITDVIGLANNAADRSSIQ